MWDTTPRIPGACAGDATAQEAHEPQSDGCWEVLMERREDKALAPVPRCARCGSGVRGNRAALAALVATLEGALLVARDLFDALDDASATLSAERTSTPVPPSVVRTQPTPHDARHGTPPGVPTAPNHLSTREREVLRLLAAGYSNRRIAAALSLSPRTVQRHVANLYPKLGAHCRAEATAYALRHGLG